jgi:hypothetical protein
LFFRVQGGPLVDIIPDEVDTAFLYFYTRGSAGDEIAPFAAEIRAALPKTYIWAGDEPVEGAGDDPVMGAVLATVGGYANALVDGVMARFQLSVSRIVLCGHQHGACVALAAAMMRRTQPMALTVLFDPWPPETLYLEYERNLPQRRVACIDNRWVRARDAQRG